MIQNVKLGTNNIECVISKCGLLPPFCSVLPVDTVNYYLQLDHTAFCTILESFDGKECMWSCDVPNWYAHLMTTPLAVPTSRASKIVQNAAWSKLRLIINSIDWNDQTKGW